MRTPPMEEARSLYIEQSNLAQRVRLLRREAVQEPLVIWDVGLGAAANAMAAIHCYEEQAAIGPVASACDSSASKTISTRSGSRCGTTTSFPTSATAARPAILRAWRAGNPKQHAGLSWQLVPGDFLETVGQAPLPPDLIFYDMFSSKTHGEQWTIEIFRRLFDACAGTRRRAFHLHALDRRPRRASRRRFLRRQRPPRRRQGGNHDRAHAGRTGFAVCRVATNCSPRNGSAAGIVPRPSFPSEISADQQSAFERLIRAHGQFRLGSFPLACSLAASWQLALPCGGKSAFSA